MICSACCPLGPQGLICRAASQTVGPQPALLPRITATPGQDLSFVLAELQKVSASPFLQPVQAPPTAADIPLTEVILLELPSQFGSPQSESPANLLRALSISSFTLSMKTLNSTNPSIDP